MGEVEARGNLLGRFIPARYILAIMGCIGMGITYGLKINLSIAIVGMVNHTAIKVLADQEHGTDSHTEASAEDGPFVWSGTVQGAILSSYFWGYIIAQMPGGRIAEEFSAKWVMFFAIAINVVCTLLSPIMANIHYGALIAMRVGQGIGGGVTFPGMHVMLAHWAPPTERSVFSSIVYAGCSLGTVISILLGGILADKLGWEWVFYVMGVLSCIWLLIWAIIIADGPDSQKFISQEERDFILNSLKTDGAGEQHKKKHKVPWMSILKSMPFWAILIAHTCSNWGWYMVLIELPMYMKQVLNFKISENAVVTAIPYLAQWVFSLAFSKTLDTLRSKGRITTTTARKIGTFTASMVPMMCFIALCYIGFQRVLAVVLMTIAIMAVGGMYSGFLSNHIDIAPNFAGTLMAITNTVATIPGIVVPIFVGQLTNSDPTITSWRLIFWVTVGLYVLEILAYGIFGSGEEQKWNNSESAEGIEAQPLKTPPSPNNQPTTDYESTKH